MAGMVSVSVGFSTARKAILAFSVSTILKRGNASDSSTAVQLVAM
jgi:hypothetical protein